MVKSLVPSWSEWMVHPEVCVSVLWSVSLWIYICEKQTSHSSGTQTHTYTYCLQAKNRFICRQNRSPGYHKTTPQPKLAPLQSCLHLKTEQCLWLVLNSDYGFFFFFFPFFFFKSQRIYRWRKGWGTCWGNRRIIFQDTCCCRWKDGKCCHSGM